MYAKKPHWNATALTVLTFAVMLMGTTSQVFAGGFSGFESPLEFSTTNTDPRELAIGDFDIDGDFDIAVFRSNGIEVFFNDGFGSMSSNEVVSSLTNITFPIAAPVNLGAAVDLVFAELIGTTDQITSLINDGNGAFTAMGSVEENTLAPTGNDIYGLAAGELNGSTGLDVAIGTASSGGTKQIRLYEGDNSGEFVLLDTISINSTFFVVDISLGDIDNDGDLDVIASCDGSSGGKILVATNDGSGGFPASATELGAQEDYGRLAVGDLNDDGNLDIVVLDLQGGVQLDFFYGNGSGSFPTTESFSNFDPQAIDDLKLGDVNSDGLLDIAVCNGVDNEIEIILNPGTGSFSGATVVTVNADDPRELEFADLDSDGDLDMIVANMVTDNIEVFLNKTTANGPSAFELFVPSDEDMAAPLRPYFCWEQSNGTNVSYKLEVDDDSMFGSPVVNMSGITATFYHYTTALAEDTLYFWRVTASNALGEIVSTSTFEFTTVRSSDTNQDGCVDSQDTNHVLANWDPCP